MKPNSFLGVYLMAAVFTASSCSKASDTTNGGGGGPEVPPVNTSFDFSTITTQSINLNLIDMQGSAVAGVRMALYTEIPINAADGTFVAGVDELISGGTDSNGNLSVSMNIPSSVTKLYLVTYGMPYINPTEITLASSGTTNVTITPAGYGTTAKASQTGLVNSANTQNVDVKLIRGNLYSLSGWDSNGLPYYRTATRDVVTQSILQTVNAAVPEYILAPTAHPEYFANPIKANIEITEDADVWVTFVSEGAGYRSVMGYFTYPTNNPPQSVSDITNRYVILPNCSFSGSGGSLVSGDKVQLVYKDGESYTNRFPAGVSIGWFLISDGFNNNAIGNGNWTLYSFDKFNPGKYQQTLVLNDPANKLMYITFEDISRTSASCDQDYNDVVFYCTSSPYEAINQEGVPIVKPPKDTDGDGVIDQNDAYPNDPALAYDSYYPAKNVFGTMAYEDLWPSAGDYDFNDLVVDLNFHHQLNAQNRVVRILAKARLRAIGASYHNGFALRLNTPVGTVRSVSGTRLTGSVFAIGANGCEIANVSTVIPIFSDAYALFGNKPYTNTVMSDPKMDNVDLNIVIELATPMSQSLLGIAPYDPFMVINGERGREVHLMNHAPTSLANMTLLGSGNDISSVSSGKYYLSKGGRPWAIQIPVSMTYMIEKSNISSGYLHFNDWASSNGTLYKDWYSNPTSGYRSSSLLYTK